MEKTPLENYLDSLLGRTVSVMFPSSVGVPTTGRLRGSAGSRYILVDNGGQEIANFFAEEVDKFQGNTIFVFARSIPDYLEELEDLSSYENEPGDYDPADPDAYFPGSGEE